jgi:hypothetical protein
MRRIWPILRRPRYAFRIVMIACPKCARQVQPKRTCIYCGAPIVNAPSTVQGLDTSGWVHEGARLLQQNQLERAVSAFDKALQLDGKSTAAWGGKARALVARGERDGAIRCLDEALAIDPNDGQNKSLRTRLSQTPPGLPPGRQSTGSMASAFALASREYAVRATRQLYGDLKLLSGPDDVLTSNWICAVPPHVGWPGAPREALAHVFTKDARVFAFFFTPNVTSVPPIRVGDDELAAWGALLQSGRAHGVFLGANVVWSPAVRARVDVVNERLARLGAPTGASVELIVIADDDGVEV